MKCADDDVEEEYGIGYLPRLIYFDDGIPEPYKGDEVKAHSHNVRLMHAAAAESCISTGTVAISCSAENPKFFYLCVSS